MGKKTIAFLQITDVISFQAKFVVKEWVYEVCEELYPQRVLSRTIFYHTIVAFCQIFVNKDFFSIPVTTATIQMYALVSLKIVLGYLDNILSIKYPDQELFSYCLDAYTSTQYYTCEMDFQKLQPLKNIKDKIAMFHLDRYFSIAKQEPQTVRDLSFVLCDTYHLDYDMVGQAGNELAAVCIAFARRLFYRDENKQWDNNIPTILEVKYENLSILFKEMYQVGLDLYKLFQKKKNKDATKSTQEQAESEQTEQTESEQIESEPMVVD